MTTGGTNVTQITICSKIFINFSLFNFMKSSIVGYPWRINAYDTPIVSCEIPYVYYSIDSVVAKFYFPINLYNFITFL